MARQVEVNLLVKAQTETAEKNIERLSQTLQQIATTQVTVQSGSLDKAVQSAQQLQIHLQNAINTKTNKIDLSVLNASLQKAGTSLTTLTSNLQGAGVQGQQAFLQVARAISQAEVPMVKMNGALARFGTTLLNTVKWQIASKLIHGIQGSLEGAFQHAKNLNQALTGIQIVTGSSAGHMAEFAEKAREAATALNSTTTEYAKASLIFFQQGLNEKEAMARTNVVIKLSQVTGQAVNDIASQMTAVWNNFDDGAESLEHYADVITALGAKTAASSAEITQGLQKFAAVADTVGLSYEKAAAALATVVAVTRQSEDIVGTAMKTILARVDSLKLGDTLEDDVTLNKYAEALQKIGVNVLDSNKNLKDMDTILDDLGSKWKLISEAQKVAVAETVAGQRQYAQFMALMNNYDEVLKNQGIAEDSKGTLQEQANIWSESWEAASKRVEQAQKNLYDSMINSDFMIKVEDMFGSMINGVSSFTKAAGGILPVIGMIIGMASTKLFPMLQHGFQSLSNNIAVWTGKAARDFSVSQGAMAAQLQETLNANKNLTQGERLEIELTQELLSKKAALTLASKNMSAAEREEAKLAMDVYEAQMNQVQASIKKQIEAEKEIKALQTLTAEQKHYAEVSAVIAEKNDPSKGNRSFYGSAIERRAQSISQAQTRQNIAEGEANLAEHIIKGSQAELGVNIYRDTRTVAALQEQQSGVATGSAQWQDLQQKIDQVNQRLTENKAKLLEMRNAQDETIPEGREQLEKYIKSLDGYKNGTLSIVDNLQKEERALEVLIAARQKHIELLEQENGYAKLSYGSVNTTAYLIPDVKDPNLDPTNNTRKTLEGLTSSSNDNNVDVSEENVMKVAEAEEKAALATRDLKAAKDELKTSLKDLKPFNLQEVKDQKQKILNSKEELKTIGSNLNKKRLEVQQLKDKLALNKNDINTKQKLKSEQKALTELEGQYVSKQKEINNAITDYNAKTSDSQKALTNMSSLVDKLAKEMDLSEDKVIEFKTAVQNLATNGESATGIQMLENAFQSLIIETDLSEAELDSFLQNMLNIPGLSEETKTHLIEVANAQKKLTQNTHEAAVETDNFNNKQQQGNKDLKQRGQALTTFASTLGRVYMGYTALKSVVNVWSDEDASIMDKIMTTMMSMSMLLPTLASLYKILTTVTKHETLARWLHVEALTMEKALMNPGAAIAAIAVGVALIGTIAAVTSARKKHIEKLKEERQEQIESGKSLKETTQKATEQTSAIDSLILKYKELKSVGKDCTSIQDDIISKTADMISSFEDLAKEIGLSGRNLAHFNYLTSQLKVAQASEDVEAIERLKGEITNNLVNASVSTYKKSREAATVEFFTKSVKNIGVTRALYKNTSPNSKSFIELQKDALSGNIDYSQLLENYEDLINDSSLSDKERKKLKEQLQEPYEQLKESLEGEALNMAWDIVNQSQEAMANISTQQEFDEYKKDLISKAYKTANKKGLDAKILVDQVQALLLQNEVLEPYLLNETRFETIEKNLGKKTSKKIKKEYDEEWDEETQKAFSSLSFDNIFSEKTLRALVNFQKALNIEQAAYDAVDGLEQVNEKLKATGMSAKDWEEVEAGLEDSGLNIDINSFKALSYDEQKNIIDTAKRLQLQTAVQSNKNTIAELETYLQSNEVEIPQNFLGLDFGVITTTKEQVEKAAKNWDEQAEESFVGSLIGTFGINIKNPYTEALENIKNEEELVQGELNNELKKQSIYIADFGEQVRNATSLQELDALVQEGNKLFNFLDIHYEDTGYYQQGLINIASEYDNTADEIIKYQAALASSNKEMQQAAEETLKLSITVGQLAEQYGLEAEDVEIQAKLIKDTYTNLSNEGVARLAVQNQRINKGVADLNKNFTTWNKTLTTADKFSTDYASTLQDVYESIANLTGATGADAIAIDFLSRKTKSGTAILALLEKAAQGDIKAIQELTKEVAISSLEMAEFQEHINWDPSEEHLKINKIFEFEDFEITKAKVIEGIQEIYNNIDNLAPGTTITEELLGQDPEEFVARLNKMAYETHMSVESMNALLSQIGVDIPVETEYIAVKRELPEYKTIHTITKLDDNGSYEEITKQEPTGGKTEAWENVPIAKIGKNAKVIKYTGGAKIGGISPSSTSENASSKSTTPAPTKNKSDETERYHVINKETEQLTKAYDRLNTAKDRAFGANRLKLMDAEIVNTKKQIALNKEYIKEAQAYAQQDYNNLINGKQNAYTIDGQWYSSEGLRGLGIELQLDENGVIQNYDEIMAAATAKYNERIAAYNANPENSNLKEIADAEFNAIKELISQYEESNELVQDKLDENKKLIDQLQDQNLEKFNYKLELKFKISEREKKRIEFELRKISDDAFKSAEALSKMFSTDGSSSQWSIALEDLKTYEKGFDDLNDLYAKHEVSEEGYVEGLEKISDGIYEQLETILDLKDTMEDYYSNTLSKLKEKYDELRTAMSHTTEVLEHLKTVLSLSGRGQDFAATGALLEAEAEAQANAYDVSKANYEKDVRLFKQREKELAEARKNGGKEQIKIAEENYKDAREAMNASELEMYNDLESWLQARWSLIENATASTADQYGKMMTDGMGFDYLNQVMTLSEKTQERYLTKTNQIYETEKLRRKLQQDLDKTTNAAARQRIALFDRELQALRDKNELSKTELSLAQGRYELLLAQIALEEAQNAKTTVRLQRDAEGNYGYVYTADQNAIAEAEQNATDAENNLYNTAREAQNELVKEMFATQQEYSQAIADLWNNQELSTEEKQQRETELRAQYNKTMSGLAEELGIADIALATWSATGVNDTWTATYTGLAKRQTEFNADSEALWDELRVYLVGEDGKGGAFKIISDAANNVLGVSLIDLKTKTNNLTTENKKLKEELVGEDGKGGLVKATEDEANAVAKSTIEFGKAYDKADEYFEKLKEINKQIDKLIEKATKKITQEVEVNTTNNYHTVYTEEGPRPPAASGDSAGTGAGAGSGTGGKAPTTTKPEKTFKYRLEITNADNAIIYSQDITDETAANDVFNGIKNKWDMLLQLKTAKLYKIDGNNRLVSGATQTLTHEDPHYMAYDAKTLKPIRAMSAEEFLEYYVQTGIITLSKSTTPRGGGGSRLVTNSAALYDTGGYTGRWYHSSDDPMMSGKLAMLHEKELVLNQEDTKNFLASIEMVRDLARIIDLQAASVGLRQQLEARFGFDTAQSELAQNIVINADFPNATDHNEIMEALETLADRAAQYANRTNRLIDSMQQRR